MRRLITMLFLLTMMFLGHTSAKAEASLDATITICRTGACDSTTVSQPVVTQTFSAQASGFFGNIFDTSLWPARWYCGTWTPLHGWIYISSDLLIWLSYFAIPVILAFFVYKKRIEDIPFKVVLVLFIAFILIKVVPSVLELKSAAYLEKQVNERTKDLIELNDQLHIEMAKRKKASDHLRATNQELMAFSYSVSHDLRAPLRSIHGFSQALLEDYSNKLDDEGKDFLQRICNASSRMGELIDDMLKLSKISRNEITLEEVNLSAIAHEVIASLVQRDHSIKTVFEIEDNIVTHGDHKLLMIAMENLISNAVKYSSKNKFSKVQFGKMADSDTYFIKDNGVGFDMKFADKLFGAFQRLHEGEIDGSGIGLATVKRIIAKHGGNIWADAKVDEGATFYFTL